VDFTRPSRLRHGRAGDFQGLHNFLVWNTAGLGRP
jgi:hypothetical protein